MFDKFDPSGGILLGPTAFGRIPGFTHHIFPSESIPYLSLVANIGLALFLFLVGLEIDAGVISRNAKMSMTVALAGIVIRKSQVLVVPMHDLYPMPFATCSSFRSGCRFVHTVVPPVRRPGGPIHAFHAFCRCRVLNHCVPSVVSYPHGAQAFGYERWNCCPVGWGRE